MSKSVQAVRVRMAGADRNDARAENVDGLVLHARLIATVAEGAGQGDGNAKALVSLGEKHRAAIGGCRIAAEIRRDLLVGNGGKGAEGTAYRLLPLVLSWLFWLLHLMDSVCPFPFEARKRRSATVARVFCQKIKLFLELGE